MNQALSAAPGSAANIEPATWRDLNVLRHLEQVCFAQDAWPLWDLVGVLTFPNVVRLKATHAGVMIGFIGADIRRGENVAWISTLCVLPGYRRQGIGLGLLRACEAHLEARLDIQAIRLSVRASNHAALQLYGRAGYHHFTIWPRYYGDGEDALVLEKTSIEGKRL